MNHSALCIVERGRTEKIGREVGNYEKHRKQLEEAFEWPTVYMFKFIVPAENKKVAQLQRLFEDTADIRIKESRKGNYLSITIKEMMMDPDAVLEVYQETQKIDGLIAL